MIHTTLISYLHYRLFAKKMKIVDEQARKESK